MEKEEEKLIIANIHHTCVGHMMDIYVVMGSQQTIELRNQIVALEVAIKSDR